MANFFDQFDVATAPPAGPAAASAAPPPAAAGGNFFDQFDAPAHGAGWNPATWSAEDNPLSWVQKNYERQYPQQAEAAKRLANRGDVVGIDAPNLARRAREGFEGGYGEPVLDTDKLIREGAAKLPTALQAPAQLGARLAATPLRGIDQTLRGIRGAGYGISGAVAGAAQDLGMGEADANALQRDLGIMTQFPGEPGINPDMVQAWKPRAEPARPPPAGPAAAAPASSPPRPGPSATPRPELGIDLLPPDVPHAAPAADMAARRSAGAAGTPGTGPLADVSPATIKKFQEHLAHEGFTPDEIGRGLLEQRLGEMSQHHFLGELTPGIESRMAGLATHPGASRSEIVNTINARAREAGERMKSAFDRAFGANENRAQLQRVMTIERDAAAQPFYDAFRNAKVRPTPELTTLIPALEESGALRWANKALRMERQPLENGFTWQPSEAGGQGGQFLLHDPRITSGGAELPVQQMPTTQAFQYAKEFLDKQIDAALAAPGGANEARIYTGLKNALVKALDEHPDRNVAGLWRAARDTYATPTQIMQAMKTGERVLTDHIHADELPFLTASYSPAELRALKIGVRGYLEDRLGRPGRQERGAINQILAPNNQSKIRWAIGDKAADELIAGIEHEESMHGAPTRIIHGSPTGARVAAQGEWGTTPGFLQTAGPGDLPHSAAQAGMMGVARVGRALQGRSIAKAEAAAAKLREEAANLHTLQGAERDAVARALLAREEGPAPGAGGAPPRGSAGPAPPSGPAPRMPRAANLPLPGEGRSTQAPLERQVIDRGRTGRPIKTTPLPIGNENSVLDAGFERSKAPTFYSAIDRTVQGAKQDKASPEQWLGTLKNTPGIKPEEMEWLGLPAWLKQQKGTVTKQQIADYVRANNVDVREVEKGRPVGSDAASITRRARDDPHEMQLDLIDAGLSRPEAEDAVRLVGAGNARALEEVGRVFRQAAPEPTKFSSYQLPGGENYRELLLTLPERSAEVNIPAPKPITELPEGYRVLHYGGNPPEREWAIIPPGQQHARPIHGTEAASEAEAIQRGIEQINLNNRYRHQDEVRQAEKAANEGRNFRGSHWDEPNVLSHIRFNDRVIDGKKTLFIEEIQSDWHQKGRRHGYAGELSPELKAEEKALQDERAKNYAEYGDVRGLLAAAARNEPRAAEIRARNNAIFSRLQEIAGVRGELLGVNSGQSVAVPNAPFKTTWPELSLKRMIRYAAEHGYEQIAWTNGETQIERYIQSVKQLDKLDYDDRTGALHGTDINGNQISESVPKEKLADYIGKDAARRLLEKGADADGLRHITGEEMGAAIRAGGEHLRLRYDTQIPAAANKLVKKYGAKVGESKTATGDVSNFDIEHTGSGWRVVDKSLNQGQGQFIGPMFKNGAEAEKWLSDKGYTDASVHTLPLTPSLRRASVTQGMPQFARGGRVGKKLPHAAVGYVARSRVKGEHCSVCSMYGGPNQCSLVAPPISPDGWCRRFDAKTKPKG